MPMPKAHDYIMDITAYVPGRATAEGVANPVKLSANESVFGPSPKAVAAYKAIADGLALYPDGGSHDLREAVAETFKLDPAKLVFGAGSEELLSMLVSCYAGPGDEVIFPEVSFIIYPILTSVSGATSVLVPNGDTMAADVDGILAAVTSDTKIVMIDNPNNPTGAYNNWDEVKRLHAGLRDDILLILDGAYAECATAVDYQAGEALVESTNNVVMTRTFSKMYALAGLRAGWCYAPDNVCDVINRVRLPFALNLAAQAAARAAVLDVDHAKAAVEFNNEGRAYLTASLSALGLRVVPSQANFVFIEFPDEEPVTAKNANDFLTKNGYLLRHIKGPLTNNFLRLTIGTEQQNRSVVELLREFLDGGHCDE